MPWMTTLLCVHVSVGGDVLMWMWATDPPLAWAGCRWRTGLRRQRRLLNFWGGGDITKEALTASCDIAEQTAGPRWAWENSIMVPRRIDGETEAQSEPCVEQRVSTSICTENATFYHVRQLSQAVSDPHEWTRCCGSAHKSASHPGDKTCWHWCRSSAEPLCFGWALNTVTLTPSAIIRLQKFRQTLAFLWGWSWKHCVNPQNSFVICKLSHLPLQQRRFITYIH